MVNNTYIYHPSLIESYTSCRLIPLDKNPGIRPIGVGEVLRQIIGKTISVFLKEEIKQAAGPLQVCTGHSAGATVHAMSQVFEEEGTDGFLLIDASNAFNQMNRAVAMHDIQITCKELSMYIINTYRSPSRLFICSGGETLSQEGTTQGDPLAMPWHSINTSIMIQSLRALNPEVKQVWLTGDSGRGGRIAPLYSWYNHLCQEGKKFGYLVNGSKRWLIVKSQKQADEAERLFGLEVIIRRVNATLAQLLVLKSTKTSTATKKSRDGRAKLIYLLKLQEVSHCASTKGDKSKFAYSMRTIEYFEEYVDPIQEAMHEMFLPLLFGQEEPLSDELCDLVTLTPAQGGVGMPDLRSETSRQYAASKSITSLHVESTKTTGEQSVDELKKHQQSIKTTSSKSRMEEIDASLSPDL